MNNQAVEILGKYIKCRYPNVALEYYFSAMSIGEFAYMANVTTDKFRRVLDGTAVLSLDELASLERMLNATCGHKRGLDYLASRAPSVYDTSRPKQWHKVKWIYSQLGKAQGIAENIAQKNVHTPQFKNAFPYNDLAHIGIFPRAAINAILDYLLKVRNISGTAICMPIKKGDILEEYPDIMQAVKDRVQSRTAAKERTLRNA